MVDLASFAPAIDAALERARSRTPELPAPTAALRAYVTDRLRALLDEGSDPDLALDRLEVADLYLAWACGQGDSAAIVAFERAYFGAARVALARMKLDASTSDEVLQMVREKLFVAPAGSEPRVLALAGRGDLGTLVRVTAVRLALNLRRDGARLVPEDEHDGDVVAALAPADGPLAQVIAVDQRTALKAAIEAAVAALEPRQRNLLRLHLLHRLNVDEIGAIYHVSRATAARWLAQTRGEIERGTRRHLSERLALDRSGIDSVLRVLESSLDVSFERLLASRE